MKKIMKKIMNNNDLCFLVIIVLFLSFFIGIAIGARFAFSGIISMPEHFYNNFLKIEWSK